ncbi:MAG: hypothetical protein ACREQE_05060 [Candidatus Binataceae bacterium]
MYQLAVALNTGRGTYRLSLAAPAVTDDQSVLLTLALERADGIERVVLHCRIAASLLGHVGDDPDALLARLGPWLQRDFEQVREAALKSIRAERKLLEIHFEAAHRGPF